MVKRLVFFLFMLVSFLIYPSLLESKVDSFQNLERYISGVVDRFEGQDQAVILIESLNQEMKIPLSNLPEGIEANTWVHIKWGEHGLPLIHVDQDKTNQRKEVIAELRSKLLNAK